VNVLVEVPVLSDLLNTLTRHFQLAAVVAFLVRELVLKIILDISFFCALIHLVQVVFVKRQVGPENFKAHSVELGNRADCVDNVDSIGCK